MYRTYEVLICSFAVFVLLMGCSQTSSEDEVNRDDATPEQVFRRFLIANLNPDEDTILNLIVDHEEAGILWASGSYPEDVAETLTAQYKHMNIVRVDDVDNNPDRVLLRSSASPIPIHVMRVNGVWKVDASPIIEFRIRAQRNEKK